MPAVECIMLGTFRYWDQAISPGSKLHCLGSNFLCLFLLANYHRDADCLNLSMLLQATFEKLENEMKEVNNNAETLKKNFLELTELKHILQTTQNFFDEASG